MPIYKNQGRTVAFQMLQTSGLPYTGTPPTVQVYRDTLAPVLVSGAQHVGDGYWKVDLAATHLDADLVVIVATATDCIPAQREIYTESDWNLTRAGRLDNLDVAVSSRSTFAGGTVAGIAGPVTVGAYSPGLDPANALTSAGFTSQRAVNLDRLDANISTRLATTDYVAAPTANVLVDTLSAAGFTPQRAENLDRLDTSISTRLAASDFVQPPTPSQLAASVLVDPTRPIQTSASGEVQIDLAQRVPAINDPETIGDSLNAARAQGFGAWTLDFNGRTLKLFAADGVTVVRTFTLDSMTSPTSRV